MPHMKSLLKENWVLPEDLLKMLTIFAVHEYKIPSYVKIDIEKLFLSTINYLTELQTAVRLDLSQ